MIVSDLANRLTKMIFKETVDRMNRGAIMGFMGMADGGRIKVTLNCRGSATFMRGGAGGEKQCKYARESVSSCELSAFSFVGTAEKPHFTKEA